MKSIVRMTVAAAVLLFSAGSLAAQGPDGQKVTPEQRAERMTQRMTEQLSLSDEQARQIEQILLDHFKEMPQAPRRPVGEPSARQAFRSRRRAAAGNGRADQVRADRCPIPKMDRDALRNKDPARSSARVRAGAGKAKPADLRFGLSLCGGRFGLIVSCGRLSVSEVRSPPPAAGAENSRHSCMIEQRSPVEKGFRGMYVLGSLRQLRSFGPRSGSLRLGMSVLRPYRR